MPHTRGAISGFCTWSPTGGLRSSHGDTVRTGGVWSSQAVWRRIPSKQVPQQNADSASPGAGLKPGVIRALQMRISESPEFLENEHITLFSVWDHKTGKKWKQPDYSLQTPTPKHYASANIPAASLSPNNQDAKSLNLRFKLLSLKGLFKYYSDRVAFGKMAMAFRRLFR